MVDVTFDKQFKLWEYIIHDKEWENFHTNYHRVSEIDHLTYATVSERKAKSLCLEMQEKVNDEHGKKEIPER